LLSDSSIFDFHRVEPLFSLSYVVVSADLFYQFSSRCRHRNFAVKNPWWFTIGINGHYLRFCQLASRHHPDSCKRIECLDLGEHSARDSVVITQRPRFLSDPALTISSVRVEEPAGASSRGWISLWAGTTKNSKARKVAMPQDVRDAVEACCTGKEPDAYVFTWPSGKPILDFRVSWAKACKAAGTPGLRFHDLRRSATRNIMRRGISATVAMKITGHLTRAVFDAYDVTADQDLLDAATQI
jgi:Phage integrase family